MRRPRRCLLYTYNIYPNFTTLQLQLQLQLRHLLLYALHRVDNLA